MAPFKKNQLKINSPQMKHFRFILLLTAGFVLAFSYNSCKKGPEDPFFSIWSRKHRVVGDWRVSEYKVDFVDSLRQILKAEPTVGACGPEFDSIIWTYDFQLTFGKEGDYSSRATIYKDTIFDIVTNTATCPDVIKNDSVISVTQLEWNFTGKIGDVKNKEQLLLFDPETKETTIFDIIGLREKEMLLETVTVDPVTNVQSVRQYTLTKI